MSTAEKLLTAEEFMRLPESIEGGKMELVCGKVVTMSPVGRPHSKAVRRLDHALTPFVESRRLGELHVELGFVLARRPDMVRAPDLSFIAADRLESAGEWDAFFNGAPSLAIEVRSPDDRPAAVQQKVREYLAAGCPRVWDVDPGQQAVTVHRSDGAASTRREGDTLTSDDAGFGAEGFTLALADLFS
jgi:Uma2 family endonuclease